MKTVHYSRRRKPWVKWLMVAVLMAVVFVLNLRAETFEYFAAGLEQVAGGVPKHPSWLVHGIAISVTLLFTLVGPWLVIEQILDEQWSGGEDDDLGWGYWLVMVGGGLIFGRLPMFALALFG